MIHGGGEEVDGDRPMTEKLLANLLAKGPLRVQDLGTPTERVRQDVELPRNELGEQTNTGGFAKTKDGLRYQVEGGRAGTPFLAQVSQS